MTVSRKLRRCALAGWLAGAAWILTGCERSLSSHPETSSVAQPIPRRVQVVRVVESPLELFIKADGFLAAFEHAVLSTKVSGRVQRLPVDLGGVIREGELVAEIERREYELRVRQAEALLAQARVRLGLPLEGSDDRVKAEETGVVRQYRALFQEAQANRERLLTLSKDGIVPRAELESAEAAYQVALSRYEEAMEDIRTRQAILSQRRAELEMARQLLADTRIYAPFDGVIHERRANLGEFLSAGTPVATLVQMDPLRLRLEVPEVDAAAIKLGQKVYLGFGNMTNQYVGEVKRLSPVIEEQTRMLRVEADVPNPGTLRPGALALARIAVGINPRGILIPKETVVTFAGTEKVFVIEQGKAVERPITTGRTAGDLVEVTRGLESGNLVVVKPGNLQSGQSVTIGE